MPVAGRGQLSGGGFDRVGVSCCAAGQVGRRRRGVDGSQQLLAALQFFLRLSGLVVAFTGFLLVSRRRASATGVRRHLQLVFALRQLAFGHARQRRQRRRGARPKVCLLGNRSRLTARSARCGPNWSGSGGLRERLSGRVGGVTGLLGSRLCLGWALRCSSSTPSGVRMEVVAAASLSAAPASCARVRALLIPTSWSTVTASCLKCGDTGLRGGLGFGVASVRLHGAGRGPRSPWLLRPPGAARLPMPSYWAAPRSLRRICCRALALADRNRAKSPWAGRRMEKLLKDRPSNCSIAGLSSLISPASTSGSLCRPDHDGGGIGASAPG